MSARDGRGRRAERGLALAFSIVIGATLLAAPPATAAPDASPAATAPASPTTPATRCADHTPTRRAFFGDLHVHTSLSSDAWVFATRTRPEDAYRFASGAGEARMDVITGSGVTRATARIPRPLDFAAVTDHAEMIGAPVVCTVPGNPGYESEVCRRFRAPWQPVRTLEEGVAVIVKMLADLDGESVCGADGARCREGMGTAWQEIQDAAARFDEPCTFSTLVGFEYSSNPEMSKTHRNVIFRNARVPALPVSSREVPTALGLWQRLVDECLDAGTGCDALTIPHNPNLSNGRVFALDFSDPDGIHAPAELRGLERERRVVRLRRRLEPLVEMFQIKGSSECRNGLAGVLGDPDPLCDFENYRSPLPDPADAAEAAETADGTLEDCGEGVGGGALLGRGCFTRRDFARHAVSRGLREADRIGLNPFEVGFIGSTDIHEGLPGDTDEWVRDAVQRPQRLNSFGLDNPGGLAGVWAEQNTRDAIFDALRRRETFATSGPRMQLRFFGGWQMPEDICTAPALATRGYTHGVPMGGVLSAAGGRDAGPVFVASALADPGLPAHPGGRLQRLQIIKLTADEAGRSHQRVIDVAGGPNEADVDLASCKPRGGGASALCARWQDPDYDPDERAAYYARVVENPSCRAFTRACLNLRGASRPPACDDPAIPRTAQERAWSSPIWVQPD